LPDDHPLTDCHRSYLVLVANGLLGASLSSVAMPSNGSRVVLWRDFARVRRGFLVRHASRVLPDCVAKKPDSIIASGFLDGLLPALNLVRSPGRLIPDSAHKLVFFNRSFELARLSLLTSLFGMLHIRLVRQRRYTFHLAQPAASPARSDAGRLREPRAGPNFLSELN
jgi:hypothetical protein